MESKSSEPIRFCELKEAYECFSNHFASKFIADGCEWLNTEQYFQAQKFLPTSDVYKAIIKETDPEKAKQLSRTAPMATKNWEEVKDGIMEKGLTYKFTQNAEIKKTLLDTGDREIIEANEDDSYWGEGKEHKGKNRLGKILMKVRERIRKEAK